MSLEIEGLKTVIEKQGQKINGLRTLAVQLANYYFVSQAVVFSALLGNSSSLKCHDVWFPLVLSLLPGLLNLWALHVIGKMYIEAYVSRDLNIIHLEVLTRASLLPGRAEPNQPNPQDPNLETRLNTYFYACIIAFAFLAIVIAFGSVWFLCLEKIIVKHHDHDNDDAKCLKLCDGGACDNMSKLDCARQVGPDQDKPVVRTKITGCSCFGSCTTGPGKEIRWSGQEFQ